MLIPVIPAEEEDLYLLWAAKHQANVLQKKNILQWGQVILYGGGSDSAPSVNGKEEVLLLSETSNLGFPGAVNAGASLSGIFNRWRWIWLVGSLMSQLFSLFTLLKEY